MEANLSRLCQCGCGGKVKESKQFISGHQNRGSNHPQWNGGRTVDSYGYTLIHMREHPRANTYGYVKEHILKAERALGKLLPPKSVVHHHTTNQLVICQDQKYHLLLHRRAKALSECCYANWRKCKRCHQYDAQQICVRPDIQWFMLLVIMNISASYVN